MPVAFLLRGPSAGAAATMVLAIGLAGAHPARAEDGRASAPVPRATSVAARPAAKRLWGEGVPRPFLAAQLELGTTEHARVVAGWGKPWWIWGGLLADGWANADMGTFTAGARAALLAANLEVHWRATRHWERVAMPALERHTEVAEGGGSTLHAWDFDAWGVVPTPGGYLTWEGLATRLLGLPRDVHVFDEGVHAVVRPPWAGFASAGWVADLAGGTLNVGGSADLSFLGRGSGARRVRAGPALSWTPWPRWTLRGQLLFTLSSPDALPAWDALSGGLVFGYRTATGARPPGRGDSSAP